MPDEYISMFCPAARQVWLDIRGEPDVDNGTNAIIRGGCSWPDRRPVYPLPGFFQTWDVPETKAGQVAGGNRFRGWGGAALCTISSRIEIEPANEIVNLM